MEFHPPSHFLEEIASISFVPFVAQLSQMLSIFWALIHCATYPRKWGKLSWILLCNFLKDKANCFLNLHPFCNFHRYFPLKDKATFLGEVWPILHIFILYATFMGTFVTFFKCLHQGNNWPNCLQCYPWGSEAIFFIFSFTLQFA